MRSLKTAMLLAGLALCAVSVHAQPSPARYSADGLYNLANSYAKAGKPGLAVLNYERAALLAPEDADIEANLEYVRAAAHVPAAPRSRGVRIVRRVSPALAAWAGVLGLGLAGSGLVAARISRRLRPVRIGALSLGAALMALAAVHAMLTAPEMHAAVVLVDQTPARVAPVPMGDAAFSLAEAQTVTITAEHEDFALVRTQSGLSGWVARASLGMIVPQAGGG